MVKGVINHGMCLLKDLCSIGQNPNKRSANIMKENTCSEDWSLDARQTDEKNDMFNDTALEMGASPNL